MTPVVETINSLKPPNLRAYTRKELREYFINSWELQDTLFKSLTTDHALYLNPDPLRNPLIFYLGHPIAFYVNKLRMVGLLKNPVNAEFERLFAAGVDPETPAELEAAISQVAWPTANDVWEYRARCFDVILEVIERAEIEPPIDSEDPAWALLMSIEHDRIHFETSSVLFRQLPTELLQKPDCWQYGPSFGASPPNKMINVSGATVRLGKPSDFPTYGWDNEYGHLEIDVPSFYASKYLITNGEFLEFVQDGGYLRRTFWSDESWAWNRNTRVRAPRFWIEHGGEWLYRTLFEETPMSWDWPVEVNHHEAMAFCKWRGMGTRLLSESEWNVINGNRIGSRCEYENDNGFSGQHNLNLRFGSPTPVHMLEAEQSTLGFFDVMGNVWVWLADYFHPLPGFHTQALYPDFSVPFFDERHSMMLGGSWATTGAGASRFYRLWFRRHFYQHAGFRIASSWGMGHTIRWKLR